MTDSSSRIQVLERLLGLEKKRAEALAVVAKATSALNQIEAEIAAIEQRGASAAPKAAPAPAQPVAAKALPVKPAPAPAAKPAKAPKVTGERKGRGDLKQTVLALLAKAGAAGITVKEIADITKSKPGNIFAWFNSTGKKVAGLKKIGRGKYALAGSAAPASKPVAGPIVPATKPAPAPAPKPAAAKPAAKPTAKPADKPAAKDVRGKAPAAKPAPAKAPAAPASKSAPAKGPAAPAPGKRRPRGSLTEGILKHLKAAGTKGVSIKAIAADLKTNPRNVSIWLVTTGKQFKGITKLSRGVYGMKG